NKEIIKIKAITDRIFINFRNKIIRIPTIIVRNTTTFLNNLIKIINASLNIIKITASNKPIPKPIRTVR
ncbi:uncharacterized protein B0T23DRAFT_328183, partial [Neurospora hispaniola]